MPTYGAMGVTDRLVSAAHLIVSYLVASLAVFVKSTVFTSSLVLSKYEAFKTSETLPISCNISFLLLPLEEFTTFHKRVTLSTDEVTLKDAAELATSSILFCMAWACFIADDTFSFNLNSAYKLAASNPLEQRRIYYH